jgi:drug/metabolite transporter (DMT)-like permease
VAILFGALVAVSYGSADFLGGFASRRTPTVTVLAVSQLCGLGMAALSVAVLAQGPPRASDVLLAAAAGVVGLLALGLLYWGLAIARMSMVAPISAIGAGVIPVLWGIARVERPSDVALIGIVVVLLAAPLIALGIQAVEGEREQRASRPLALMLGCGAGVGFGVVLILFAQSAHGTGLWPVLIARLASVPVLFAGALLLKRPLWPTSGATPLVAGAGTLDVTANALILLAVRRGFISLVAPVAALYPASTVALARLVLKERITRMGMAGLALALVGLVLLGTQ